MPSGTGYGETPDAKGTMRKRRVPAHTLHSKARCATALGCAGVRWGALGCERDASWPGVNGEQGTRESANGTQEEVSNRELHIQFA